nr:MAG TPA: YecR-like lipoprotein [Caudoviricetes sp.]
MRTISSTNPCQARGWRFAAPFGLHRKESCS